MQAPLPPEAQPGLSSREKPLSVADIIRLAKLALDGVGLLWLEAEIAQVSTPSSGHVYMSLRDRDSVMPAVMWRSDAARLKFRIDAGQRLLLRGRVGVYDRDGKMQLYIEYAEPAGVGAAALAFEQLKAKLAAEGLFAPERKRPLPRFPKRIGVVTSKTGAAVHDIIRTVTRRFPTPIAIADCMVQGKEAPQQIVEAMVLAVQAGCDVIIVGRGGGAATDLSAFNHERVVRTVARCPIPVISAVGHEVDLTLCDLAADARASTPTAAAELAVPSSEEIAGLLKKESRRLDREVRMLLDSLRQSFDLQTSELERGVQKMLADGLARLKTWEHKLAQNHPAQQLLGMRARLSEYERRLGDAGPRNAVLQGQKKIAQLTQRLQHQSPQTRIADGQAKVAALGLRSRAAVRRHVELARSAFIERIAQLNSLSPLAVMERGYAVVRTSDKVVRDLDAVAVGDAIDVYLRKGALRAVVAERTYEASLGAPALTADTLTPWDAALSERELQLADAARNAAAEAGRKAIAKVKARGGSVRKRKAGPVESAAPAVSAAAAVTAVPAVSAAPARGSARKNAAVTLEATTGSAPARDAAEGAAAAANQPSSSKRKRRQPMPAGPDHPTTMAADAPEAAMPLALVDESSRSSTAAEVPADGGSAVADDVVGVAARAPEAAFALVEDNQALRVGEGDARDMASLVAVSAALPAPTAVDTGSDAGAVPASAHAVAHLASPRDTGPVRTSAVIAARALAEMIVPRAAPRDDGDAGATVAGEPSELPANEGRPVAAAAHGSDSTVRDPADPSDVAPRLPGFSASAATATPAADTTTPKPTVASLLLRRPKRSDD